MKFTTARADRPRNPMVAPARFRLAGPHQRSAGGRRQLARRELARELGRAAPSDTHSP